MNATFRHGNREMTFRHVAHHHRHAPFVVEFHRTREVDSFSINAIERDESAAAKIDERVNHHRAVNVRRGLRFRSEHIRNRCRHCCCCA